MQSEQNSNEYKLAKAKEYLGEKWILHPSNSVSKKKMTEALLTKEKIYA